jgi:hypothetical protein
VSWDYRIDKENDRAIEALKEVVASIETRIAESKDDKRNVCA